MEHIQFLATINFTNKLKNNTIGNVLSLQSLTLINFVFNSKKKKNCVNKNQGWEPIQQKYKANENTSRNNPKKKNKSKQSTKIR